MHLSKIIYRPAGQGLGDCVSTLNICGNISYQTNEIVRVSDHFLKGVNIKGAPKLYNILPLLSYGDRISIVKEHPTAPKFKWYCVPAYPYLPAKLIWQGKYNKTACYQFDGKSHGEKNFKSAEEEQQVLSKIKECGYTLIQLGALISLEECVQLLSNCEVFIGVESGMGELAACVRTPIIYVRNNKSMKAWNITHKNKRYVLCNNAEHIIQVFPEYSKNPQEYFQENLYAS